MATSCKARLLLLVSFGFLLGHADRMNGQVVASTGASGYKATYNGLIYPEDGLIPEHYGFFRVKVSPSGAFSGQIQVGQKHAEFSGHFDSVDSARVKVKMFGPMDCPGDYYLGECIEPDPDSGEVIWIIYFQLTNGRETISGQADFQRGAGWSATLSGVKAGYNRLTNPAPQAGQYSFILPGGNDPQSAPAGESYGTLKVDTSGNVKLTGTLANGTPVTFGGAIARDGSWPVYIRQAHGHGLLIGSANFHEAPTNGPTGILFWLLPRRDADFYPQGFYLQTTMAASVYQPRSTPIANASGVALIVETGDGSMSFTNILTLGSRGSMANQSPNAMTIRFNPNTGSFTGTVQQPGSGQSLRFGGAALQSENAGFGYFLGNHQAGSVLLLPAL